MVVVNEAFVRKYLAGEISQTRARNSGLTLTAIGLGFGLAGALLAGRWLRSLLFGVTPTDPAILAIVALVLGAAAVGACLVPALRALRVDPMKVLRNQ